jgi:hypothetical protein
MGKKWLRRGGLWVKKTPEDGAGNSKQYLLGSVTVENRKVSFTAHPNENKKRHEDPDFVIWIPPDHR